MGKIHDNECFLSKGFTDGYYGGMDGCRECQPVFFSTHPPRYWHLKVFYRFSEEVDVVESMFPRPSHEELLQGQDPWSRCFFLYSVFSISSAHHTR